MNDPLRDALTKIAALDRSYDPPDDTSLIDCAECHGSFSLEDGADPCPECHGCSTNLLEEARMVARRALASPSPDTAPGERLRLLQAYCEQQQRKHLDLAKAVTPRNPERHRQLASATAFGIVADLMRQPDVDRILALETGLPPAPAPSPSTEP